MLLEVREEEEQMDINEAPKKEEDDPYLVVHPNYVIEA